MRWSYCLTEFITDSEAVVSGRQRLLQGNSKPWKDHNNLWHIVQLAVLGKGSGESIVTWVKVRAAQADAGLSTSMEAERDKADARVVQGRPLPKESG